MDWTLDWTLDWTMDWTMDWTIMDWTIWTGTWSQDSIVQTSSYGDSTAALTHFQVSAELSTSCTDLPPPI